MGNGGAFTAHISTVASLDVHVAERCHFSIQYQIRRQAMETILFPRVSIFFHGNVASMSMCKKKKSYIKNSKADCLDLPCNSYRAEGKYIINRQKHLPLF